MGLWPRHSWTVRFVKLTMMPIETGSGLSTIVSVAVPRHVSISVVSAACALGNPTSITARAITHEQARGIGEARPVQCLQRTRQWKRRLLPLPTLGERRHRGLAHRLVAVHRSYALG